MQDSLHGGTHPVLLRPDVPVRVPDVGLDPRRARADRARHHLALLLARGGQPGRGQEAPVGAAVVVRLGPDAGRLGHPPRARQRRARPLVRGGRLRVLRRRRQDARARRARRGAPRERVRPRHRRAGDRRPDHDRRRARRPRLRGRDLRRARRAHDRRRDGLRDLRSGRRARAHRRRRGRALGPREGHGPLPAPVRAAPSEDPRRPRARCAFVRDVPDDARLEHGREPGPDLG